MPSSPSRRPRTARPRPRPAVLSVAGSDSGGGAGLQADLKTFAALGVHGTTAVTCVTAQNPERVASVQALRPELVADQIAAVRSAFHPKAIKTGMLYSAPIIRAVAAALAGSSRPPLIVDPVMVATSGAVLLQPAAVRALVQDLLPLATLVTPNLDETRHLLGRDVQDIEDLRRAARELRSRFGCAVLAKGGHLPGPEALDVFWDGREELLLGAPRIRGLSSHGTGCTYSAAIAGYVALGCPLPLAVQLGKQYITSALASSYRVERHPVLEHFWTP